MKRKDEDLERITYQSGNLAKGMEDTIKGNV